MFEAERALKRLIDGQLEAVILEAPGNRYVQFALDAPHLRCEAVGDVNLREPLSPDQLRQLRDLGFAEPDSASGGNHFRQFCAEPIAAANFARGVLLSVYGVGPGEIVVSEV